MERLRQQQIFLQNDRHPDYDRDPYFYTAPIYRYQRGGRYYETNQYGADLLRQAINYGYQEGFHSGAADRQDGWRSNYRGSYAYQDANYGYTAITLSKTTTTTTSARDSVEAIKTATTAGIGMASIRNGSYSMLDAILSQVLGFQPIR